MKEQRQEKFLKEHPGFYSWQVKDRFDGRNFPGLNPENGSKARMCLKRGRKWCKKNHPEIYPIAFKTNFIRKIPHPYYK